MVICRYGVQVKHIIANINLVLREYSYARINLVCALLVALISALDVVVGYEVAVSIFFLIPIAVATWYGGQRTGIFYSLVSSVIWFFVDNLIFFHPYINPVAPYWNAYVRLGFFLVTEELLNYLKIQMEMEKTHARTDALTGLLNVRGFTGQVEKIFALAARHNRQVTIAYIDLDNFKQVNDEQGHSEGDKVLQVVSKVISSALRTTDIAGRMGGDEFAIVLPETDEAGARTVFGTLRAALLLQTQNHGWSIGYSIGVVSFDAPPESLDAAIKIADSLMYRVKTGGKNSIVFESRPAK